MTDVEEAQTLVRDRLVSMGFPFGDHPAQVAWAQRSLASGDLEVTSMSEQLAHGRTIDRIARTVGLDELRVYHHLSRRPGEQSDGWRLIYADEREDRWNGEVIAA